jgi:hypothetical protein
MTQCRQQLLYLILYLMFAAPCSVEDIFAAIENDPEPSATKYLVRASYLQIYNEVRCAGAGRWCCSAIKKCVNIMCKIHAA